jgi:hypothetical protein
VAKINLRSILKDVIDPAVNLSRDMQNAAGTAAATAVNNNATPAAANNNINSSGVPVNNNATLAAANNNINSAGVPVNNNATPAAANNNINSAGVPVNNNATPAAGNIIAAINSLLADSTFNQPALETPPEQDYQQVEDLFEGPAPVAIVHDREWFQDDERLKNDLRRPVRPREWSINTPLGDVIHAGSDANFTRSRLDYFLLMFPLPHLNNIVRLTNSELTTLNKRETTAGEVLKFFGILILISNEFSARASLWSNTAPSKYLPAARIGSLTGILVLLVVYVLLVLFYFTFSSFHFILQECQGSDLMTFFDVFDLAINQRNALKE